MRPWGQPGVAGWEVEGCRESLGLWPLRVWSWKRWGQGAEMQGLLTTANLPQLVATAPRYPCFVTQTAARPGENQSLQSWTCLWGGWQSSNLWN